jgi:amidase
VKKRKKSDTSGSMVTRKKHTTTTTTTIEAVKKPGRAKIRKLAAKEHLHLKDDEVDGVSAFFDDLLRSVGALENLYASGEAAEKQQQQEEEAEERRRRRRGEKKLAHYRPDKKEDPYNAFVCKFLLKGSGKGPLKGKRVAVKDNINVRGIPTTNASALSRDYIPDTDATVVSRLLDAGADVVGKLNMDNLSFSGTSETSVFGPVKNPVNIEYSPGGSSSGSGAAVAGGLVDIALGVDQGGSARVPACCTGIVSIKPTHGLVPTYGLTYFDHTLDHICPVAKNVEDAALTLEAIAGYDPDDPQWTRAPPVVSPPSYSRELEEEEEVVVVEKKSLEGMRVGAIIESFSWEQTDPEIRECFLATLGRFRGLLGCRVEHVSIPLFKHSGTIWITLIVHSAHAMYDSSGEGYWRGGRYNPGWNEHIGRARFEMADEMPPLLKCSMIAGRYLREEYFSSYHSKAQNLRNALRKAIDVALDRFDVLTTPTMIVKPPKLKRRISFEESLGRGVLLLNNTTAFNLSGHPAITVPCGVRGGFPVGLQLIAKHYDESTLFRVARAFESGCDWKRL